MMAKKSVEEIINDTLVAEIQLITESSYDKD
jgi:hypothetical protein